MYAAEVELAAERAAVREPLLVVVRLCDNQFALCMTPYRVLVFSLPDAYHMHPDDAQEVAKVRGRVEGGEFEFFRVSATPAVVLRQRSLGRM